MLIQNQLYTDENQKDEKEKMNSYYEIIIYSLTEDYYEIVRIYN